MNDISTERLSLQDLLARVRALAARERWAEAGRICQEAFPQCPDAALAPLTAHWVRLLRLQQRPAEACRVLHRFLQRMPWGAQVQPEPTAPVLLLVGTGCLQRGDVLFHGEGWDTLVFAVNGGHFDVAALLRGAGFGVDRLFVGPHLGAAALQALAARVARYRVVVNTIADPASEQAALEVARALLQRLRQPVLNAPQQVMATHRHAVAARLAGLPGLVVPRITQHAAGDAAGLQARFAQAPQGLILRPVDSQTGIGMALVSDADALAAWQARHGRRPAYAIDFHDFRDADGLYRKFRFFAVGGRLMPEHMIAAAHWNVHSADRYQAMGDSPRLRDDEAQHLADPRVRLGDSGLATLQAIAGRIGLDWLGIDFARLPTGELLLFEANPAMRLNFDHCARFPDLQPHLERVSAAFQEMVQRHPG